MTYETAFKRLKEKFNNVDAAALENMAIQITLSDEDCGGTFYAEVKEHELFVEPYDYKDNDAVMDVDRKTLSAILDGKTDVEKAIENGDLSVKGNLEKIHQIKAAIKAPVKKTAAKTASKSVSGETQAKKPAARRTTAAKTQTTRKTAKASEGKRLGRPRKKTSVK